MDQPRHPRGTGTGGQFAAVSHSESGITLGKTSQWPALEYEERPWNADPDHSLSRRSRLLARGPYEAAVPPEIAELEPVVDSRTQALAEAATVEMVRFDTDMGHDPLPFSALLLRSESASSSQIENLTAGARRIALARLGDTSSSNAALVASNVRAMQAAVHFSEDLSVKNIALMHHALLNGSNQSIAGQYRDTQVWIRGNSPHTAEFVPPHHDRVPKAMDDLVAFMRRDDIPVLTQAAIAHAQFETIHPFADGNGRTGRAIVSSLLKAKEVTRKVTVPVSSGLLTDTRSYFDALDAYREGDVAPIVERFAESSVLAVDNGRRLAQDIRAVKDSYAERAADAPTSVRRILELLPGEPAVTADMLAEYAGLSTATSYRAIERLQEAGILAPAGKIKGTSIWVAPDILAALDAFADRAGRRSRA
ncbi:Fic family protein [Arthrobacter sp. zg-Y1110]|uniref:Fic family protein n=1 Tax=Arthrobacter sp. zg-Y1110 TaxID=2886932 RepID=UPI001D15D92D|nr:Fic family protein [Arthrobacter sp. zg-Y1110]MCC3292584.1 Fic family protein [Arthrobacter sp. zg-Y1110]UWX86983.1 Fic family protein [Arthrobacter sp. zg-Y1110]